MGTVFLDFPKYKNSIEFIAPGSAIVLATVIQTESDIRYFNWVNPFARTNSLESIQTLTVVPEMQW
jgi:hypothetical protein